MPITSVPAGDLASRSYITATAMVNEIPPSLSFIDPLLFGDGVAEQITLTTEDFEIVVATDTKTMAPYIRPGTRPPASEGLGYTVKHVATPMIADARPFDAAQMMLERRPGVSHYASAEATAAHQRHMAAELARLRRRFDNRKEWQACQLLDHSLEYDTSGSSGQHTAAISIDYAPLATSSLTLSVGWDDIAFTSTALASDPDANSGMLVDASVYQSDPSWTFDFVGRVMIENARLNPTDAIMDPAASAAFRGHPAVMKQLDNRNYDFGSLSQIANNRDTNGARFLGVYNGVRCWEYAGQLEGDSGTTEGLLGSGKVYFVHIGPAAGFQRVHGMIPNYKLSLGTDRITTFQQMQNLRAVAAEMFADVVMDQYGNSLEALMYGRPLQVLTRPDAIVAVDVINGTYGTTPGGYAVTTATVPPTWDDADSTTYTIESLV